MVQIVKKKVQTGACCGAGAIFLSRRPGSGAACAVTGVHGPAEEGVSSW